MNIELGQIISQIIAFLITLWILKKFAWKPLLGIMEERRELIKSEFALIETEKKNAEQLVEEYHKKLMDIDHQAYLKIQDAIDEGKKISEEIQEESHRQAKAIVHRAQEEIHREVAKARAELKQAMVTTTIAATQKMIGEHLDTPKQKKLIAEFIDQAEVK